MSAPPLTVAVLGTGAMGSGMARSMLRAGLAVRAWNRTRERAEPLAADGARVASTPAEAVAAADVALTMLADAESTAAVAAGADGMLGAVGSEAVWLQMGTVGLAGADRLAELAEEAGVPYVDAPVLGTREPAERGELLVLASGPEDALARCAPVLDAVGSRTMRLGPAGAGSRMKLVLNTWLLELVGALGEAVVMAEALGVAPERFLEAIAGGPVDAPYAQLKGQAMIRREFPPSFALDLARKDVRLVIEAALASGVRLDLAPAVAERLDRASARGHGGDDLAAVVAA